VFNESVSDFATGDVTLAGTAGATTATVTGSGTTYNVAVTGMTSDGTVTATIDAAVATDAAGNSSAASTSTDNTVTRDTAAPTVVSINRAGASATVRTGPLTWTATFSEPVTGVTTSNFALVTSGTGGTAPSITTATAVGGAPSATWTITVSTTGTTGTNSGSIGLNLANTTNIKDVAAINLSATTPVVGQAYTYDTTAPLLTSVTSTAGSTLGLMQTGDTLSFNFSEALDASTLPSTVTVTEMRSGNSSNASLTISSPSPGGRSVIITTGTIPINVSYVNGGNSASGTATGTVTLTNGGTTILITLGTVTGNNGGPNAGTTTVPNLRPDAAIEDVAGNNANATQTPVTLTRLF
jgi:hypothetical protein